MPKLVRVKPYAPKKGHLVRRIVYRSRLFRADRGWYEVDDAFAKELATLKQPDSSQYHGVNQPVFDVTDLSGAEELDKQDVQQLKATPAAPYKVEPPPPPAPAKGQRRGEMSTAELRASRRTRSKS
jgi:hypothetical protein